MAQSQQSIVSERGFTIGSPCQIRHGGVYVPASITKISIKPDTSYITVDVTYTDCDNKQQTKNFLEWERQLWTITEEDQENKNIDYNEQIFGCNGIIKSCKSTKRIINAMKSYQNKSKQEIKSWLIKYVKEEYSQILNDWCHLMNKHNDPIQLEQIFEILIDKYELNPCDVTKCPFVIRHHRDRTNDDMFDDNKDDGDQDDEYLFYRDLFDGVHCYLYHLVEKAM